MVLLSNNAKLPTVSCEILFKQTEFSSVHIDKVIREKSHGEGSLMEQDTIENVS